MSLRKQILNRFSNGAQMSLSDIYSSFPKQKESTLRGRLYENLGKGITRIGKGLYISSDVIIENADALRSIDRMIKDEDKFDFIFLDIPYFAQGQLGGNRNLFDRDKISPEQFGEFIQKAESLLKHDNSPIAFMFTSGKTSKKQHDKYLSQFEKTGLVQCEKVGKYTKLWKNGNRMNMGKYLMPKENIYFFSRSGIVDNLDEMNLDYWLNPNVREYPSCKPIELMRSLVSELTKIGDWVLDPFGGSGKTLEACLELGRKCHIIESSEKTVEDHILKLIEPC